MNLTTTDLCRLMEIDFSEEQLSAITAPLEPSVIMAGAGSGKTSVMTARVIWLVANQGIAPEGVLGLTFTNKAAAEFRGRVRNALASLDLPVESADAATVTTYHAFAQQLLVDDGVRVGLEPEVQLLSDVRREQLAMQVVRQPAIEIVELSHASKSIVGRLLALDDRMAEEAVEIAAVRAFDERLVAMLSERAQQATGRDIMATSRARLEALALVEQFRALKLRMQCIDYADMVRLALRLVRERDEVAQRLRRQFPVVLLDEYQDTSVAQRMLMQHAFTAEHAITAVGDALQAIYEWRGASAINITDFPRHFARSDSTMGLREAPVFGLPKTQRFGSRIAAAANDVTAEIRGGMRHVQALVAQSDERFGAGRIDVALHADAKSEFVWIADQLRAAHAHTEWKDMAILLRQHRLAADLAEVLADRGIPVQVLGKQALLRVPDIADVVAYLHVIHDPAANPQWVRILSGPRYQLGVRDIAHLGRRAQQLTSTDHESGWQAALANAAAGSDVVDLVALGEAIADPGDSMSQAARERVAELHAEISALRRFAGQPISELVRTVVHRIGLDVEIDSSQQSRARARREVMESFAELVADFAALDGAKTLPAFLQWLRDGERLGRQAQIDHPVDRNAVTIMTVHAAKGLQRDLIVLPALVEGVFPSSRSDASWTGAADVLPFAVLHSFVDPDLLAYPSERPTRADHQLFAERLRPRKVAEETRLAYVAITRAQQRLIVTAARAYEGKVTEPSRFLLQLRESALRDGGTVHCWAEGSADPAAETARRAPWPQELDTAYMQSLQRVAAAVQSEHDEDPVPVPDALVGIVQRWDTAIAHLAEQRLAARRMDHAVPLPPALSATQAQSLARDAAGFLSATVRPMPRRPAVAAKRGSAFHAWIERQYGQQLLLADELASDDEPLDALCRAFEASEWAARTPLALELPFVIGLGGFCIRGRIDAVYRDGDDLIVVDWKTNTHTAADPLQLSIYRHAAAAHFEVPAERIRTCFVYVAQGRTEWHQPLDVQATLEASVGQWRTEPALDGAPGD